jgi:hypothetical protein
MQTCQCLISQTTSRNAGWLDLFGRYFWINSAGRRSLIRCSEGRHAPVLKWALRCERRAAERVVVPAVLALVCGFVLIGTAHAQTIPAENPPVQGVEVKGTKDPALLPYRKAYDLITGVAQAGGRHVELLIRVTSTESHQPMPDLSLHVVGENTDARVPISPAGFIDLPMNEAFYADNDDIVANKPKKTLAVDINVVPRLPSGEIRFADLIESTSAGQAALASVVPWYVRVVMPSLQGVSICYPAAGQEVALGGEEPTTRTASEIKTDPNGVKVFCAKFSVKEAASSPQTLLKLTEGWEALYW